MSRTLAETVEALELRLKRLEFMLRDTTAEAKKETASQDDGDGAAHNNDNKDDNDDDTNNNEGEEDRNDDDKDEAAEVEVEKKASVIERVQRLQEQFDALCSKSETVTEYLKLHERVDSIMGTKAGDASKVPYREKLSIVLANEDAIRTAVSQLATLEKLGFPDTKDLAELLALRPRLERASQVQEQQNRAISQLRAKTAELMIRWHKHSVLHMGRRWSEIEQRLMEKELELRREAAARSKEEDNEA